MLTKNIYHWPQGASACLDQAQPGLPGVPGGRGQAAGPGSPGLRGLRLRHPGVAAPGLHRSEQINVPAAAYDIHPGLTVTGYEVNRIWWEGEHSTPHFIKIGEDF